MSAYSARVRFLAAKQVAHRVAVTQRLGRDQEGMLTAFLNHLDGNVGVNRSWVWGKPHVHRRVEASLVKRGLIELNGDGEYWPNASLQSEYQAVLPTIPTRFDNTL